MGAYKKFNSQDIIISPFEVNKGFSYQGDALTGSNVGIDRFEAKFNSNATTGKIAGNEITQSLLYDSIKHLYYSNYISGSEGFIENASTASFNNDGTITGPTHQTNFYNYLPTTLWPNRGFVTASAAYSSSFGVISIPSKLFGDYIQPKSFLLSCPEADIFDDGEGRLKANLTDEIGNDGNYIIGNILYEHGIVTLFDSKIAGADNNNLYGNGNYGQSFYDIQTNPTEFFIDAFITSQRVTMSFSSSYKIFETQYQCTINENEFNYSLNPTIFTGSTYQNSPLNSNPSPTSSYGNLLDFATSSYFEPYITTVGLYDDNFNLLAVGKLGKPLQTSAVTDTTILVNIDR